MGVGEEGGGLVQELYGRGVAPPKAEERLMGPRKEGHPGEANRHLAVPAAELVGTVGEGQVDVVVCEPGDGADGSPFLGGFLWGAIG